MFEEVKEEIRTAICGFDQIIDAHEHLAPETDRLAMTPDVCFLFSHYLIGSLLAAGAAADDEDPGWHGGNLREYLLDTSIPFREAVGEDRPLSSGRAVHGLR